MAKPQAQVWHVSRQTGSSVKLKDFLLQHFGKEFHKQLKQYVRNFQIAVNGLVVHDLDQILKSGDVIHLYKYPRTPLPEPEDIGIVHVDPFLFVVNKPALMTTMPHAEEVHWKKSRQRGQMTLLELLPELLAYYEVKKHPRKSHLPKNLPEVIPVHRLDRDTSGLMVFARSREIAMSLTRLFANHSIDRKYQAIVNGEPDECTIENYLTRDRGDGLRGSTPVAERGELAITHVKTLETSGGYSLVECRLETGRTHQIRIHLSEAGYLICGEPVYYKKKSGGTMKDPSDAPRLALHASELGFEHPATGRRISFRTDLPEDLLTFWSRLVESGSSGK